MGELEDAWAAGFIDGEGYLALSLYTLKETKYQRVTVVVRVNQVDKRPLLKLKEMYGGSVNPLKQYANRRQAWGWRVASKSAESVLKSIVPFLINKKEQAELLLEVRSYSGHIKHNRLRILSIQEELKDLRAKEWVD